MDPSGELETVFRLSGNDVAEVVDVLCEAFRDYPVMRFVLGTDAVGYEQRRKKLVHYFVRRESYAARSCSGSVIDRVRMGPHSCPVRTDRRARRSWASCASRYGLSWGLRHEPDTTPSRRLVRRSSWKLRTSIST